MSDRARGPTHRLDLLARWLDIVDRHQPYAALTDAALAMAMWPRDDFERLLVDVAALAELLAAPHAPALERPGRRFPAADITRLRQLALAERQRGGPDRVLKRGALLHAEIAMLAATDPALVGETMAGRANEDGGILLPTQVVVQVLDGEYLGIGTAPLHWDVARRLLDLTTPQPSGDPDVRLWYRAASAHMGAHGRLAEAVAHLEHARRLFDADAWVFLDSGVLHERFASREVQALVREATLPGRRRFEVGSERANLRRAEAFFRRAIELDPGLAEARVRLARVMALQGRTEEAVAELDRTIPAARDPIVRYYAHLFRGWSEQTLGRDARALESSQQASALHPQAQSPYVALSHLAWRNGDREAALAAIRQVLALPAEERQREDPWWSYHLGAGRDAARLVDELREATP